MRALSVIIAGEKIAIVRKTERQLQRQLKECYINKYGDIKIERLR